MKLIKKYPLKGFFVGVLFTLCLTIGIGTVGAASKLVSIKVAQGGISLYVDEKLFKPMDVKGNAVEPFIYDGTTYLPVRAISNALNKEITWDSKTSSIYIGKAPTAAQIELTQLNIFNYYEMRVITDENASVSILNKTIPAFNRYYNTSSSPRYDGFVTYILDSKYSKLKGDFVMATSMIGDYKGKAYFYNVDAKGTETLISEYSISTGDNPTAIDVNLTGVNILKISLSNSTIDNYPTLYNMTLETQK